jgi:hypothetical protein
VETKGVRSLRNEAHGREERTRAILDAIRINPPNKREGRRWNVPQHVGWTAGRGTATLATPGNVMWCGDDRKKKKCEKYRDSTRSDTD